MPWVSLPGGGSYYQSPQNGPPDTAYIQGGMGGGGSPYMGGGSYLSGSVNRNVGQGNVGAGGFIGGTGQPGTYDPNLMRGWGVNGQPSQFSGYYTLNGSPIFYDSTNNITDMGGRGGMTNPFPVLQQATQPTVGTPQQGGGSSSSNTASSNVNQNTNVAQAPSQFPALQGLLQTQQSGIPPSAALALRFLMG